MFFGRPGMESLARTLRAPKAWAEREAELAAAGIDPRGQLAVEVRHATAHERAEWRKLVVAAALLLPEHPDASPGALYAAKVEWGPRHYDEDQAPLSLEAAAAHLCDGALVRGQGAVAAEDHARGAALLALADRIGLGGCRGLTGDATVRIPQLATIPSKCAPSGAAWTAEVERWAERARGYYLRPVVAHVDDRLHVGIALLDAGEALDLCGATRRAFVGLAGLPALPQIANPTAGLELPAAHIRAIALNAGLELALGVGRIPHARLAPGDMPIWAAIAEVCALMGEDGPAYSGIWRISDQRLDLVSEPLTLERVQHLLHDHKPAGEVPAPDDDGLDG